jgi:hypothetical protein
VPIIANFKKETNGFSITINGNVIAISGTYSAETKYVSDTKFSFIVYQNGKIVYGNVFNTSDFTIQIAGVAASGDINSIVSQINAQIPTDGGGSGMTALSNGAGATAWDGSNRYDVLTANLSLTLTPGTKLSGILDVEQGGVGSYTLTINGISFAINTAVGSLTSIGWYISNSKIKFVMDKTVVSSAIPTPDTTAPTISFVATSATNIRGTGSEAINATLAGFSFKKNGAALTPTAITQVNATTWDFTVPTMLSTDTLLASYDSATGNTVDLAATPNELVSFTDAVVTNSITSNTFLTTNRLAFYKNSSMTRSGGQVTKWANVDGNTAWDFSPYNLSTNPVDATTQGMQITNTENFKTAARISQATPITIYALIKKTASGGAIISNTTNGNGYGILMNDTSLLVQLSGTSNNYWDTSSAGIGIMSSFKVLALSWAGTGTSPQIYLDGTLVSGTLTQHNTAPDGNFIMDYLFGFGSNLFKGYANGLAFFSAAHDAATIATQSPLFKTAAEA